MSARASDLYRVLHVDPAAHPLVIQAAYRTLARIFHPDVQGDDELMKRLNAAWEVLGDPGQRAEYDRERERRHVVPADRPAAHRPPADRPAAPTPAPAAAAAKGWNPRTTPSRHDAAPATDVAGPPRGMPFGPVITFGRYGGWSIGQIARVDRPYLDWLRDAPAGRGLRTEIDAVLRNGGMPGVDRRRYDLDHRARNPAGIL